MKVHFPRLDLTIDFRHLPAWPLKPTLTRDAAPFRHRGERLSLSRTLDDLRREIGMLGAFDVMIESGLSDSAFRADGRGLVKSFRQPMQPGVILRYTRRGKWDPASKTYASERFAFDCDRFCHWEDNLRAIVLALESFRVADRYGVGTRGQVYTGFAEAQFDAEIRGHLEAAFPTWKPTTPQEKAAAVILEANSYQVTELAVAELVASPSQALITIAVRRSHPDQGGTREALERVLEARAILLDGGPE